MRNASEIAQAHAVPTMQPLNFATGIRAELPAWVLDETADVPGVIPDFEDRMRLVHRLANRNYKEGNGGPFAALVADSVTGEIISLGVNVVLASGLSSMHAARTGARSSSSAASRSWRTCCGTRPWRPSPHTVAAARSSTTDGSATHPRRTRRQARGNRQEPATGRV
jgi:hypothetical protein